MVRKLMFAAAISLFAATAGADTPTVTINSPTGTIYVASFPYAASLNVTVSHTGEELRNLHVLNMFVDGVSLFGGAVGDPFDTSNNCKNPNLTTVTTSCSTNASDTATFSVPWSVPGPGSYVVTLSIKHTNEIGADEETVTFNLLAIEYPAPPSIANAYINKTFGAKASAKIRGCVINRIAENHAKFESYGPKGGPYNKSFVEADTLAFWGSCQP